MNHNLDDRILRLEVAAERLSDPSASESDTLQASLRSARLIINEADSAILPLPQDLQQKIQLLDLLQRLAYHDPDTGRGSRYRHMVREGICYPAAGSP